ncbi:tRNA uridine 5-oxyacetic acid(34) methyltransferase CmoM [Aurantivibrio plasticivorans]
MADRNFDDLAHRFQRNVYSGLKGEIRLAILQRDFREYLPIFECSQDEEPITVLDAGGGLGQMARLFATRGHNVTLCDISENMLALADEENKQLGLDSRIEIKQLAIQNVAKQFPQHFDVVTCHAVMEWVDEPQQLLDDCLTCLKPGGYLSLSYYNIHGSHYKNLLRTNFKKFAKQQWGGYRGSLTPSNPLEPETVMRWIDESDFEFICESGIRTFHDYILNKTDREREPEKVLELELEYSRIMPFMRLGRYIHVLLRKPG